MLPAPRHVTPNDLFWERAKAAREIPPEQRLLRGLELFDEACTVALDAIHGQHPEWSEEECQSELKRRIHIHRQLEDEGLYYPVGDGPLEEGQ